MSIIKEQSFDYKGLTCTARLVEEEAEGIRWNTVIVQADDEPISHVDKETKERKKRLLGWTERRGYSTEKQIEEAINSFKNKIENDIVIDKKI